MMEMAHSIPVEWKTLVQAEYREMPGLSLTKPQMRRFWGMDEDTCNTVVDALERERFLKKTPTDAYVIARGVL